MPYCMIMANIPVLVLPKLINDNRNIPQLVNTVNSGRLVALGDKWAVITPKTTDRSHWAINRSAPLCQLVCGWFSSSQSVTVIIIVWLGG